MKRLFSIVALLLLVVNAIGAYDFMEGGIAYDINSDGTSVTVTYAVFPNPESEECTPSYPDAAGSLIIPKTVTHNSISYSVTAIGYLAFWDCSGFTELKLPESITKIEPYAFMSCTGFKGELVLPNSLTSIDNSAFSGCEGFTGTLTIPGSVTFIGECAFECCNGFSGDLILPNSLTSINCSAFGGCWGFTSLSIPNSVTTIDDCAFQCCSKITGSLVIPESVTYIGQFAFEGLPITSLSIPGSVSFIGYYAFRGCGNLTYIDSHVNHPSDVHMKSGVFDWIPKDKCILYVPVGCEQAYRNAPQWNDFTQIIEKDWSEPGKPGDITGEGTVDVDDINILVNILVGRTDELPAADINGDGKIDVDDINQLINIILGKS